MHKKTHSTINLWLAIAVTLLVSLACSLIEDEVAQTDLQSTIVALESTKTFLENQPPQQPIEQTEAEPPALIEVTSTPVIEMPEEPFEEQPETPDINFEGIQFSFDATLASSVNTAVIPGQNLGADFMPGETYPTYYEFTFNQYPVSDHAQTPKIIIYPVEEYRAISVFAHDQFNNLEATLINRPGGSTLSELPFLPMWPAAQLFSAQVNYFDFQNGSGLRYLTMYVQNEFPVDNSNLFYTYQGITQDGRHYISAIFPITHPGLPEDGSELIGDDYLEFLNQWDTYLLDTLRLLGEQPPDSFYPNMQLLDAMIASILIER